MLNVWSLSLVALNQSVSPLNLIRRNTVQAVRPAEIRSRMVRSGQHTTWRKVI
jgi:hypothetical protein